MVMTENTLLLQFCFIFHLSLGKEAPVTSMGQKFMFSVPRMSTDISDVIFSMSTSSETRFAVNIKATLKEVQKLNDTVYIFRHANCDYTLDPKFHPSGQIALESTLAYRLVGNRVFSLTVVTEKRDYTSETFQALPVTSWGKRYVSFSLTQCPLLLVASEYTQNISVTFRSDVDNLQASGAGETKHFTIPRMHAYSVVFSELNKTTPLSFMGAILEGGYPFGVVIGSCGDSARPPDCNVTDPPLKLFAEMVVPGSAFGKDFVGFNIPGISNMTLMYFTSLTDNAVVQISRSRIEAEDEVLYLEYAGDTKSFPVEQSALSGFRIQSSKPVQIILLQRAPCLAYSVQKSRTGDATISLILPNSLFYIKYTWWTPPVSNTVHHVVVVIRIEDRVKLRLHHPLLHVWGTVVGKNEYLTNLFPTNLGINDLETLPVARFGCYLYGESTVQSYMHPVGYQDCTRTSEEVKENDHIDNDCDGAVDEEVKNNKDDDKDSLIDEDIHYINRIDGHWGTWDAWECESGSSQIRRKFRRRYCDNPAPVDGGKECEGPARQDSDLCCKPINGNWGPWNEWSCWHSKPTDKRHRSRKCDQPEPADGGSRCLGGEIELHNLTCAKVHGSWGSWLQWTCESYYKSVTEKRRRECDNPAPALKGNYCRGEDEQLGDKTCEPVNGGWGEWNEWLCVSNTLQTNKRYCDKPRPKNNGAFCQGAANSSRAVKCSASDEMVWGMYLLIVPSLMLIPTLIMMGLLMKDNRKLRTQNIEQNNTGSSNGSVPEAEDPANAAESGESETSRTFDGSSAVDDERYSAFSEKSNKSNKSKKLDSVAPDEDWIN